MPSVARVELGMGTSENELFPILDHDSLIVFRINTFTSLRFLSHRVAYSFIMDSRSTDLKSERL